MQVKNHNDGASENDGRLDPRGELAKVLGRLPHQNELGRWAAMPTDRREKTIQRIRILRRWTEEAGEITAAEAAAQANVKVSRFYEIAAAWKTSPTLDSVGTFAKRPGRTGQRLNGETINIIQSVLPGLVQQNADAKVASIVERLKSHPQLKGHKLPHVNTLRTMAEREKRRLKAEKQVGTRPGLDACACELLREDGNYHELFAVVDRTSRLILGFSVGSVSESRSAYARAARDALTRIGRANEFSLPWADTTTRIDVIVGEDVQTWKNTRTEYADEPLGPDFELVSNGRRYGRYLKLAAGGAIGDLKLLPARTGAEGRADTGHRYSLDDAISAIEIEVNKHNDEVMAENIATGSLRPAPETLAILEFIAHD